MIVWNGIERYPTEAGPVVATIGNFDGVHLGHRAILGAVVSAARATGRFSLLVTFEPHPLEIVAPHRRPKRLQTRRQKLDALEATGLEGVLILKFDAALAAMNGDRFFADYLASRVTLARLLVGPSFRFGRDREGDLALIETLGRRLGFEVGVVPPVDVDGVTVSSSAIRARVEDGDVERARRMLGRPFAIEGEVVPGESRGRALEFPTANIATDNEILPRRGVYVTETSVLASRLPSVTNVGVRPTFGGERVVVETHIMDFDEDLYGERLEVRFLARLRDERRFSGPSELADQIARDRAAATTYFQSSPQAAP